MPNRANPEVRSSRVSHHLACPGIAMSFFRVCPALKSLLLFLTVYFRMLSSTPTNVFAVVFFMRPAVDVTSVVGLITDTLVCAVR